MTPERRKRDLERPEKIVTCKALLNAIFSELSDRGTPIRFWSTHLIRTRTEDDMRVWFPFAFGGLILGLVSASASGQGLGGSIHLGTLGLGGRVTVPVGAEVNIRAGVDLQPISIEESISDVDYDLNLPSPSFLALLDWHPGGGEFRATGGVVSFANELELEAALTEDVNIGGRDYFPSEIGTLIGSLGTARFAPYLGTG